MTFSTTSRKTARNTLQLKITYMKYVTESVTQIDGLARIRIRLVIRGWCQFPI